MSGADDAAISKSAKKKAERLEKIRQKRKENRKLKKSLAKERKKNLSIKSELTETPESESKRVSKKTLKLEAIARLQRALINNDKDHLRVCIDLQFEDFMIEKELVHLARQLSRIYGANRNVSKPSHLIFAGLTKTSKTFEICCQKSDGFENYILKRDEEKVHELFDKDSIVYLTPDSDNVLEEIQLEKTYIIGGLVDDSVKKKTTFTYATKHGFQTAKLPIEKFCQKAENGSYKQILTLNQVFDIVMNKFTNGDWNESFTQNLPQRTGFVSNENS